MSEADRKKQLARENVLKAKEFSQKHRKIAAVKGVTVKVPEKKKVIPVVQTPQESVDSMGEGQMHREIVMSAGSKEMMRMNSIDIPHSELTQ